MKNFLAFIIILGVFFHLGFAQVNTNALVVLSATTRSQVEAAISSIESKGGHVKHVFEPEILLCYIPNGNDIYPESCNRK